MSIQEDAYSHTHAECEATARSDTHAWVYMRKLFSLTTLPDWTLFCMYSGDHTDRRQAYFRMIFFLTVGG